MDWSPRETFLAAEGLDEFEYGVETDLPLTVIQKFNPGLDDSDSGIERFDSSPKETPPENRSSEQVYEDFWKRFMDSPLFKYKPDGAKSRLPSGLCIFFCPRANDVFPTIPSELSDLPITREQWQEIVTKFCLYNLLVKAIRQKLTSITIASYHLSAEDPYGETSDTLQMCTVNTSVPSGQNFALSATHFKDANLTLAVILGATPQQVDKIENLLGNAEEAIGHPLLMLGLSAELMSDLLTNPVEDMRDGCIQMIRKSRDMLFVTGRKGTEYAMQVEAIRSDSLWLEEAVKSTKDNLRKALETYCRSHEENDNGHDPGEGGSTKNGSTKRGNATNGGDENSDHEHIRSYVEQKIKMRFQDIFLQLDALIAVTRISVQDMSSMSTTTGTLIAFLAMLYLPMTSVATIFAMPIFNFQNDWKDWRYQPVPAADPSADPAPQDGSTEAHAPVFSGYFWIYLAFSIGLTFVTIEGWWRVAGAGTDISHNPSGNGSQLPHWILYPVWHLIQPHL
ncbi:hypothetical protein MFIFM68171_01474 [Madurella fahalii]|uniref:Uncharacterized protein n=1 Tax=Madurella fahalii TaxID=1157608 RepID=A0ABQ0G0T0_9PEZI